MFEIGTIVKAFGLYGVVVDNPSPDISFPVKVRFSTDNFSSFTLDGRYDRWHTEPSLIPAFIDVETTNLYKEIASKYQEEKERKKKKESIA